MDESTLVVATHNAAKLQELRTLLPDRRLRVLGAGDAGVPEVAETGERFLDNALLKAAAAWSAAGRPALADDSGLEVAALDGAPGVHSARFAGPEASDAENLRRLLDRLEGVPEAERGARFVCTLALLLPASRAPEPPPGATWRLVDGSDVPPGARLCVVEGEVRGRILTAPRGEGGFGYDPLFLPEPASRPGGADDARTFGELDAASKHRVSHRGRALAGLRDCLARWVEVSRRAGT